MNAVEALDELQRKARHDDKLREQFIKTRDAEDPLGGFCSVCRETGYELYPMDIVQAGDEFYAAMKRSTNGAERIHRCLQERMTLMNCFLQDYKNCKNNFSV